VQTKQHVLVADDSLTFDVDPKLDNSKWPLEHLFPEHQLEQVLRAIENLRNQGSHSLDTTGPAASAPPAYTAKPGITPMIPVNITDG